MSEEGQEPKWTVTESDDVRMAEWRAVQQKVHAQEEARMGMVESHHQEMVRFQTRHHEAWVEMNNRAIAAWERIAAAHEALVQK